MHILSKMHLAYPILMKPRLSGWSYHIHILGLEEWLLAGQNEQESKPLAALALLVFMPYHFSMPCGKLFW